MIINGGSRCNGQWFAKHLSRADHNEHVEVIDIGGLGADNIHDAFREMAAVAGGTQCKNYFYHANLNIPEHEHLTREQWLQAVDRAAEELGLLGQPRIVVAHVKENREHWHVAWSRIDADSMTAIPDSLTYRKHERAARAIEQEFGLEPVESVLVKDRDTPRPDRRPKDYETFRAQDTEIDPHAMKAEITALWNAADSGLAFKAALEDAGYILARGDRRDFCIIDSAGDEHSLARRIAGFKAAEIRARMGDIDIDHAELPTVAEARALARTAADSESSAQPGEKRGLAEPELPGERRPTNAASGDPGAGCGIVRTPTHDGVPERVTPWGNAWRAFSDRFTHYADELSALWHDESSGAPAPVARDVHDASPQADGDAAKSWVERVMDNKAVQAGRSILHGWNHRDGVEMAEGIEDAAALVRGIAGGEAGDKARHNTPDRKSAFEKATQNAEGSRTPGAEVKPMSAFDRMMASREAATARAQQQPEPDAAQPTTTQPSPDHNVPDFD